MRRVRRTEITIEVERTLVVSRRRRLAEWCPACGAEAEMVTPSEAAAVAGVGSHVIFRRAEDGGLHSRVTPEGALLVCLNSLVA